MADPSISDGEPWWRQHKLLVLSIALAGIVLLIYGVAAATVLPVWIVSHDAGNVNETDRLSAIVNTRSALLGVLGPLVVTIGGVVDLLNYLETSAHNRRTYKLAQLGQLTDGFTKAIDQLGQDDKLDIKLGAIYALGRIAKESDDLHPSIMEILTACLREHGRLNRETPGTAQMDQVPIPTRDGPEALAAMGAAQSPLRADLQAICGVIGRRDVSHDRKGFRLDLRGVQLDEVDFGGAQLQRADFRSANLRGANFKKARLQGAWFHMALLEGANFWGADLEDAAYADYVYGDARGLTWRQLEFAENVDPEKVPDYLQKTPPRSV